MGDGGADGEEPNGGPPPAADSDEEDEDYAPGADPDGDGDSDDGRDGDADGDAAPFALSVARRKAVDDAFLDLFGYPFAPRGADGAGDDAPGGSSPAGENKPGEKRGVARRRRRILSSIFGRRATSKLLRHAARAAAAARPKAGSAGGMLRLERRVVKEVKRFAGQEIEVERVVVVPVMAGDEAEGTSDGTAARKAAASDPDGGAPTSAGSASGRRTTKKAAKRAAKGVDSLLTEMARPEKLSTLSKTSADWDLFKLRDKDGALKEQLESKARGKEAYLVKKDFLARVDGRRFELERAQRDRQRAKRGK